MKRPGKPAFDELREPEPQPVRFGNDIAVNAGVGVGVGYNVHRSGSNDQYGSNPGNPPNRPRSGDVMDP